MDFCVVLDEDPLEVISRADRMVAFCARYGRMDVRDWPRSEALGFAEALSKLLESENRPGTED
jgi:hypothetical protein